MKKKVLVLLAVVMMFCLGACGKFKCDICEKEKSGKSYSTEFLGEKITICEDCKTGLEVLGGMIE